MSKLRNAVEDKKEKWVGLCKTTLPYYIWEEKLFFRVQYFGGKNKFKTILNHNQSKQELGKEMTIKCYSLMEPKDK